jgi:molybdate transport system regulatory protein
MSYRRAWLLVDGLNARFRRAVVDTQSGGRHSGGDSLTPFGRELIARYRTLEREVVMTARAHVGAIETALAPDGPTRGPGELHLTRRS